MTRKPLPALSHLIQTPWCLTALTLLFGTLISWQVALLNSQQQRLEKQSQAVSELASVRARLEGVVFNVLSATASIAGVIAHGGDIAEDLFAALSKQAIDAHPYIRNIGIAPDDVIALIYPAEGNPKPSACAMPITRLSTMTCARPGKPVSQSSPARTSWCRAAPA